MTQARRWVGGAWALDVRGDELADIRYDGRIVLRAVQAVVRDRNWSTATLEVDRVDDADGALTLAVHSTGLGSSFDGTLAVHVDGDGLTIRLDLVSREPFDTNRTGLVVLIPPAVAGLAAEARHSDGSCEVTAFPRAISPHQPMRDLAGLAWTTDALDVAIAFAGDVFEMEDQRNWTDASFKTYSRPLDLPFPYRLAPGEHVEQSIRLTVARRPSSSPPPEPDEVLVVGTGAPVPELWLGASTAPDPPPTGDHPPAAGRLVELDLRTPVWRAALERAGAGGARLDVRIVAEPDAVLREVVDALSAFPIARVGVFDARTHVSEPPAVARLRAELDRVGRHPPVVGGARSHFTQLNREQGRMPADLDGVAFSVTPFFHAISDEQLVESLGMQRLVASQAVAIATGRPVHVGPVTLRPRFNDVATVEQPASLRSDLAEGYGAQVTGADDPRQTSELLAAWTIAAVAALAVPGVASLALFEDWGPRGIRSSDGEPHPVAAAFGALLRLEGELVSGSSHDGLMWVVGGRVGATTTLLLAANLDAAPRTATLVVGATRMRLSLGARAWTTVVDTPAGAPPPQKEDAC